MTAAHQFCSETVGRLRRFASNSAIWRQFRDGCGDVDRVGIVMDEEPRAGLGALADRVFEAVIFDLDGTLIDSTPAVLRSWATWTYEHGLTPEDHAGHHGVPSASVVRALLPADRHDAAIARINELEIADVSDIAYCLALSMRSKRSATRRTRSRPHATYGWRRRGLPRRGWRLRQCSSQPTTWPTASRRPTRFSRRPDGFRSIPPTASLSRTRRWVCRQLGRPAAPPLPSSPRHRPRS